MPHSLVTHQVLAFVAAAVGLMQLAGTWTTFLIFNLSAQTTKAAIDGTTSKIRARIAENASRRGALMALRPTYTPVTGTDGLVVVTPDLYQLERKLRALRVVGSAGPDGAATISMTAAPDARVAADWSEGSLIVAELEQILRQ